MCPDTTGPSGGAAGAGEAAAASDELDELDDQRLALIMRVMFFVLLGTSLARFVQRHDEQFRLPWVVTLAVVLTVLYAIPLTLGRVSPAQAPLAPAPRPQVPLSPDRIPWPPLHRLARLAAVLTAWAALVLLAPSFAWVAVPLFFDVLRVLPRAAAYALVVLLTLLVIFAQLSLAPRFDFDLVIGPAAVAALATAVFVHAQRQSARQRVLIDDLIRTRRELAATERRAGTLAERQRIAMEIHDSLAQGLSSQRMLLQAAERTWDTDPDKAHAHVRNAASIAELNLAESRRFVHDLAPTDLAHGGGLDAALRTLAERESHNGLAVTLHVDDAGAGAPVPERVQSALLRIAQSALANVREHSGATTARLTLTRLDDQVILDIADNGRGFAPAALPDSPTGSPTGTRGHGVRAMRTRVRQLGGTLTIESAPGEGAVLSVAVPTSPHAGTAEKAGEPPR
ncbi:two-component sensor histidine kinase [Streptomyces avidinii]